MHLQGLRLTNAMAPIYGGQWFAEMAVPTDLLNQNRMEMMKEMSGIAVVWLLVSFLISTWLAHYLKNQTHQVAKGLTGKSSQPEDFKPIRVAELWSILQDFKRSLTETSEVRSALSTVSTQRDQIQDLYDNAPCGYHSLDKNGLILNINQTELNWLGVTKREAVGRPFCDFCTPAGKEKFAANFPIFLKQGHIHDLEFDLIRRDGSTIPVLLSATSIHDAEGNLLMSRSTVFDIRERKAMELELQRLANTDTLTGLYNRRQFYKLADQELARSRRTKSPISLMMVDIDHFKQINDTYGHAMGDVVLQNLGRTMKNSLREIDVIARLGGEEFAILLPQTSSGQATELAQRLRSKIANESIPATQGAEIQFTVSIGVDEWRESDPHLDALLKRCDTAMYQAKNSGRNCVVHFSESPIQTE